MRHLMLDLFSGTGSASKPFRDAGWKVVRVELDEHFEAELHEDITHWSWKGRRPTLVWASPPCTEFARELMPWSRTGVAPSMALMDAAERVIRECDPVFFVIENSRGATRYLRERHGAPLVLGSVRLWGRFPWFHIDVPPWKERLSSKRKADRARMPDAIGQGLLRSIQDCLWFASAEA